MKGIVFNLLADMVEAQFGLEAWDGLLDATGSDGVYVATETYPDEDLLALVAAATEATKIPAGDLLFAFGEYMLPQFAHFYPAFFVDQSSLKEFLLTVDSVVHVEVRKLYPEAGLPEFRYRDDVPDRLTMMYKSPRKLCRLAEGLIHGSAEHFGQSYELIHDVCMHKGAEHCELEIVERSNA